jgi:DedD protein
LERTVVYFPKEKVRAFLRQQIKQNDLLGDATIFAAEQDGPMNLVSYRAQGTTSTARSTTEQPAIAEPEPAAAVSPQPLIVETPLSAQEGESSSRQASAPKERAAPPGPHSEKVIKEKIAVRAAAGDEQKSRSAATKPAADTVPVKRAAESRTTEKAVVVKTEPKIPEVRPAPATKSEPKDSEKMGAEQVASARVTPTDQVPEKKTSARPVVKNLEGFVIQLAFTEANAAQHWAKTLEQRGYTVSITEAGHDASFRVRMGNFALREEADRQLRSLRQEGLSGIVINLPQAYRPEVRSAPPTDTDNPVSINP